MMKQPTLHLNIAVSNMSTLKSTYSHQTVARLLNSNSTAGVRNSWRNIANKLHLSCVFFCNVGSYHFVGAYAGATACLRGHSGSLRGQKLLEICLRGLRACGFVQEVPTRLQSRRFF